MDSFIFWFMFAIIILVCVIAAVSVTQIAQIGWVLGKDGNEEE